MVHPLTSQDGVQVILLSKFLEEIKTLLFNFLFLNFPALECS